MKAIFGSMFNLLSAGRVGQPLGIRTIEQARSIFSIYAAGFTALAAEILLLYGRAWRLRDPLRLNERERFLTRPELTGWSIPLTVGIVALVLANTLPANLISWSGWIYFSLAVLVPLHRWFKRRAGRA